MDLSFRSKENIYIHVCTDILTLILFTKSLDTDKVPSDWNHANVTPVFKKGDKHNPGNYRPISLTCIACKLLEHIFASNMMQHLETNNTLYELQHGFRAKRSCESQIISLIHELSQEDLEAAIKWEQDWLMSFHPDKCNIMNITTKRNPIHFYYNMHGHILESVQHAKYPLSCT